MTESDLSDYDIPSGLPSDLRPLWIAAAVNVEQYIGDILPGGAE